MPRPLRRAFLVNALIATSLSVAVLMIVSWAQSFSTLTEITVYPLSVWDWRGSLTLAYLRFDPPPKSTFGISRTYSIDEHLILEILNDPSINFLGFRAGHTPIAVHAGRTPSFDFWIVAIPYWLLVPLALIPSLRWTRRCYVDQKLARTNGAICRRCGYDLRATPGRCPECGFEPK
jgi:hypothetical protein